MWALWIVVGIVVGAAGMFVGLGLYIGRGVRW